MNFHRSSPARTPAKPYVEAQFEDTPHDMEPYVDTEGNAYDFAFGLNWSGSIDDDRTARYRPPAMVAGDL